MRRPPKKSRTKKTSKPNTSQKPKPDPVIPKKELDAFLEKNTGLSSIDNVSLVECCYLWEKGDIQRYRLNVWVSEPVEGRYCRRNYIKHSFFTHYNKESKEIKDHTIEPELNADGSKKKDIFK